MPDWETHIDRQIRKAMEEGEFANLPGEGKPLDLGEDSNTPEHLQMAYKILRDNDMAPDWIMQGKELTARQERWLEDLGCAYRAYQSALQDPIRHGDAEAKWKRACQKLDETAARLNKEITAHNLKLPPGVPHRALLNTQQQLRSIAHTAS